MLFDGLRFRHWRTQSRADGIVLLTLDRADAPVNAISQAVLDELELIVERLALEPPKAVVIHSAKPGGFAPGADVKEFQGFDATGRVEDVLHRGQSIYRKLASLPLPTIAAIHGHCMGGGTELALACRHRVAANTPETRIALPEIKLGIYPGWGGSVRLPRMIGAPAAMDLMLSGRSVSAKAALAMGLVDRLAEADLLLDVAIELAGRRPQAPFKQRLLAWATNTWLARQILAPMLVKQVARKARKEHYPAPFALIATWQRSGGGMSALLKAEAKTVAKLAKTPTARNLVRVFFLHERLKSQGSQEGIEKAGGIRHVHVVGAGVMGGDIAAWCAYKGFEVSLQDREMRYIEPALQRADALYAKKIKDDTKRTETRARLQADVGGAGATNTQLVIEAIFENVQAKQELYAGIEPQLPTAAIIASNTSSIALADLGAKLAQPERFAGLHFFNPVAMMPLVEIVRHPRLDPVTEQRLAAFCRAIDKLPVSVSGTPGFLVNRILIPYMVEAMRAYAEGIPGVAIDKAALRFGMPMGPVELVDTVGLDVAASIGKILGDFLGLELPTGLADKLSANQRGRKDGQGFYKWENGKAVKPPLPAGYQPPDDLEDRLIMPMLNEAVAVLHARVVDDADLLDAGVIFGTGFAPFRGGPIAYIRSVGADVLKGKLEALRGKYGERFAPRAGWDNPALRD
ncbi:MAG: enoyl-CoA hydratase/isomerase family protein [Proteobacteria bacterium]|nr:enoyl-CoA hydratase/isomerase family protein [Pseudomonadota bacterium]